MPFCRTGKGPDSACSHTAVDRMDWIVYMADVGLAADFVHMGKDRHMCSLVHRMGSTTSVLAAVDCIADWMSCHTHCRAFAGQDIDLGNWAHVVSLHAAPDEAA
jgi:hypothetical protein